MTTSITKHNNIISILNELEKLHPLKPALKFGDIELNYSELNKEVEKIATLLVTKGLKQHDFIGINLPRSLETVISILAVLKIGACYIPMDPSYPVDRINFIIKDSGMKAVLSKSNISKHSFSVATINIDELKNDKSELNSIIINPDDPAYIIYTSGSTGRPKGVKVTHSNLINFTRLAHLSLETDHSDICLGTASINYALSVRQIFVPFAVGAKLVFASDDCLLDPEKLLHLIKNETVTQIDLVPSHLRSVIFFLSNLESHLKSELLNNNLKRIITVGEPLGADLVNLWYKHLNQQCPIINIFGQTETTGIICYYKTNPTESLTGIVPIGKPIPETDMFILDEELNIVPEGVEGELCVSNECVATGYINNPELTADKFIGNKFNPGSTNKIYRTGDLVVSRNNIIYYIGRKDNQVKIRGMRVEIGEIEYAINEIANVEQAIVVPIKQDNNIKLTAFIKECTGCELKSAFIKEYLSKKIPAHMIPNDIILVENFLLTPNGKIDRLKLSEYKINKAEPIVDNNLNEIESKLVPLWQNVLRKNLISVNDDFFSLGGDSLSAVNLFILIEKEFQQHLPISVLYQSPTISKLAKTLASKTFEEKELKSLVAIRPEGNRTPLFFIHGAGGNVLLYKDLVKYLDSEIPFYGLQSVGLNGQDSKIETIEEMASKYLEEIMTVQPSGPYYLGGYCMGGTIAMEIAQLLTSSGEKVNTLFLLETYNWCALPARNSLDRFYYSYQKIIFHFNNLLLLKWNEKKIFLGNKWNELKSRKNIWIAELKNHLNLAKTNSHNYDTILAEIWKRNDKAAFQYKSDQYNGVVFQFLPKKRYQIHSNEYADWNVIVPNIKTIELPVYAAGMLVEPFVKILANEINKVLKQKKF
jgi:amino acid adenylation domain-containing protein